MVTQASRASLSQFLLSYRTMIFLFAASNGAEEKTFCVKRQPAPAMSRRPSSWLKVCCHPAMRSTLNRRTLVFLRLKRGTEWVNRRKP